MALLRFGISNMKQYIGGDGVWSFKKKMDEVELLNLSNIELCQIVQVDNCKIDRKYSDGHDWLMIARFYDKDTGSLLKKLTIEFDEDR